MFFPVPPTIEPFSFQDDLAEGMRTRLICGVSRGDAPISLRWLKDGEPFPLVLAANITLLDQYSSLLSILSLTASHTGDYTCVASNSASETRYTANLQVKGNVSNGERHQATQPTAAICPGPAKSPSFSSVAQ